MDATREDRNYLLWMQRTSRSAGRMVRAFERFADEHAQAQAELERYHAPFAGIAQTLSQAPAVRPAHSQLAFDTSSVGLHPNIKPGLAHLLIELGGQRDPDELERVLESLSQAANHTHAPHIMSAIMKHAYKLPRVAVGNGGNATGHALLQFLQMWPKNARR